MNHAKHLPEILDRHKRWLAGTETYGRADLSGMDLSGMDLSGMDLRWAYLTGANLKWADLTGANLKWADLTGANLTQANLTTAGLEGAILTGANLTDANLTGASIRFARLLCLGDMKYIRTAQVERWGVAYTHDTLQIGPHAHPIDLWRQWDTPHGRRWVERMGRDALPWAEKFLPLILGMIDAAPAKKDT